MIRKSSLNISYANINKLNTLDTIFTESKRVINLFIDILWDKQDFRSKFVDFKVDTWLSARLQQCLGKQALETVKSQRKKKIKTKPIFTKNTIELDSRFIERIESNNSFDLWFKLSSIGDKVKIYLPTQLYYHFNKFKNWSIKNSIKLRKSIDNIYFIDVYFEKPKPLLKQTGKAKSLDIGYKKLIVTSDNERLGNNAIYEKITRKKKKSKAYQRALTERNEIVNKACKDIDLSDVKTLYVEDLKNVKYKSKLRKSFNNKLQHWVYAKVLHKLDMICEECGIELVRIPPAFTSQRCSQCGVICKSNRKGETYKCTCGNEIDADYNAALNILHLGEYGLQATQS